MADLPTTVISSVGHGGILRTLKKTPFVQHPVAVLLSLVLGTLLVVLIHQNLQDQVIWASSVTVVTRESSADRTLVVQVPGGFFVRGLLGNTRTDLVVKGANKDRVPKILTVIASIPIERLSGLANEWSKITLEDPDLRIQGYPKLKCEMSNPVQVEVTARVMGTIQFRAEVVGVDSFHDDRVVFDPPTMSIGAPAPFFAGKSSQDHTIRVREGENVFDTVMIENIRIDLEEEVTVRVTKIKKPDADESMDLSGIPVSVAREYIPPGARSGYLLSVDQWATTPTVIVTVFGPPAVIQKIQIKGGEAQNLLREELHVVYDIAAMVRRRQKDIDEAGDKGLDVTLNGTVLASILKRHNLTRAQADDVTAKLIRVKE